MKEEYYKQCTFQTPTADGFTQSTAWIPEHLAVKGKTIFFGKKSDRTEETRLWTVVSAGDQKFSGSYLQAHERDYKTQREASDI